MVRPNFLVIGCGKCGTTSLCALLAEHPQVFVCEPKEPDFLSYDEVYARGWPWYESLFRGAERAEALGEGSVSYTVQEYEDRVVERMLEGLGEVRLIYIARAPLARLESVYREHHNSGHRRGWHLPFTIEEALEYRPAMLTNTRYWERINTYREHVPDSRILALCLEDLRADPASALRRCFEFLGVDPSWEPGTARMHLNPGSRKCYDTRLMRTIRTCPVFGPMWRALPRVAQSVLERPLRRRFVEPIVWPPDVRRAVLEQLEPDATAYLRYCGKPPTFWNLAP